MSLYRCRFFRFLDRTRDAFQIQGLACENDAEAIGMARRMSANSEAGGKSAGSKCWRRAAMSKTARWRITRSRSKSGSRSTTIDAGSRRRGSFSRAAPHRYTTPGPASPSAAALKEMPRRLGSE
jgi:hypothetical protein